MRTRTATTHRRSMLQQGQAALLVLAIVAGQIGSYLHAAFERHAVCAEHGELIHLPELAAHGLDQHAEPGPVDVDADARPETHETRDALDALRDGSAAGDEHAHEHCDMCPASREPLSPGPSGDAIAAAMPDVVPFSLPAVIATGDRARYIIAPKTSPPV